MNGAGERDDFRDFGELDDTLADGPATADVPAGARGFVAEQRSMHGLLRALHTADATARESRVQAILSRIDAGAGAARRRHFAAVAAAALVFAIAGIWWLLPPALPTAEAAVQRAVAQLDRDVDRRFRVVIDAPQVAGRERDAQFSLVTRPGARFRVEGRFAAMPATLTIGCDGEELWIVAMNGAFRRAGPLAERERLLRGLHDVLDLGYLDVQELVRKLPADFELRVAGRETDAAGRSVLRIEGEHAAGRPDARLRSATLLVDEASGMVLRVEGRGVGRNGPVRLVVEYLREEPPGLVDYSRPF